MVEAVGVETTVYVPLFVFVRLYALLKRTEPHRDTSHLLQLSLDCGKMTFPRKTIAISLR
jgi:hypothetical protein